MEASQDNVTGEQKQERRERGVFFPGWFPRSHCYHPSLPPRRLRMVEELQDLRATMLTWPALGGGSISLPYLEEEANGPVPARYRFYGFVSDTEFIAACHKASISVFGVVFTAQGWEVPAELNDAEDTVLSLTELRGVGNRRWLGLREFSQDRYPRLWPPFAKYFPEGLVNWRGEKVTDLIEECSARDIHGEKVHAHWIECPDREHSCYFMDLNNRVWREYVKAIVRVQVEAGVDGIQFDEISTPLSSAQYGGCFCPECMDGFTSYLRRYGHPEAEAESFNYGTWLLARGYDFRSRLAETPLFSEYVRYQKEMVTASFAELSDYVRSVAQASGRELRISANTYDMGPLYDAVVPHLDVCVPEHFRSDYKQPGWYRYALAMAEDKPLLAQLNPYGGGPWTTVVAEFAEGKGKDRFRVLAYEAAAMGAVLSVPYGSWMGSVILDAAYAPMAVAREVQAFLADHEWLFTNESLNSTALLYDVGTCYESSVLQTMTGREGKVRGEHQRFRGLAEMLAEHQQPFDVVVLHDRQLRPDRPARPDLSQYEVVTLLASAELDGDEIASLTAVLDSGGRVLVVAAEAEGDGRGGLTKPAPGTAHLVQDPRAQVVALDNLPAVLANGARPQLQLTPGWGFGVNICKSARGGAALHVGNYRSEDGATVPVRNVVVGVRLPKAYTKAQLWVPGATGAPEDIPLELADGAQILHVPRLGVYGVIELSE